MSSPSTDQDTNPIPTREVRRRTRAACDACRTRKVKCLYNGQQCRACIELKIPCTQNRPRKRRGPKNQYVEGYREVISPSIPSPSIPTPTHANSALEELGPFPVVMHIIDDWFKAIHSVAPILHRRRFLRRLSNGDAETDPEFCGLVVSLCAATVTSLRRKCSATYGTITAERCLSVMKRHHLLGNDGAFTLEWCQAKYNIGATISAERDLDDPEGFRYLCEATMGVKYLIYHALPNMDFVAQQQVKRLYWLIFAGLCTTDMYGRDSVGLMSPRDDLEFLRPLDLSDLQIDPSLPINDDQWHGDMVSYIPGLNFLSNLFLIWYSSQQGHNRNIPGVQAHIAQINRALDDLPTELRWRGGLSRPPRSNFGTDVQIANLYITQLHIRSNLFEQLQVLLQKGPHYTPAELENIPIERQRIVDDLLEILSHTTQETLEANGHSLVPKIRDIGAVLLDQIKAGETTGTVSEKAQRNLERLLQKLEALDFHPEMSFGTLTAPSPI